MEERGRPESRGRREGKSPVFVSKLLSLMLRHRPDEFDLDVDDQGFAELEAVVEALQDREGSITVEDVEDVVYRSEKKRFEIVDDKIRARYGHSIPIDLGTDPVEPPEFLYKGVDRRDMNAVLREGLEAGDRQYVHLSFEAEVAGQLGGGRRRMPTVVIRVNAMAAHKAGVPFFDCGPTILTPRVPPEYVTVDEFSKQDLESSEPNRDSRSGSQRQPLSGLVGESEPKTEASEPPSPPTFGRRRRINKRR